MKISKKNKKIMMVPLVVIVFTILFSVSVNTVAADQSTIYVSPDGNDGWNGESPTWNGADGPKKSIKNAVGTVTAGGTVIIASGNYNEHNIVVTKSMTIQGESLNTVIDGQNLDRILTIISGTQVTISNLKFVNGRTVNCGGAINSKGSLTIINSTFINNKAPYHYGGAIQTIQSSLTLINSTFTSNSAPVSGAIDNCRSNLVINDCDFRYNKATNGQGGALVNAGGSLTIDNTVFAYNSATNGFGGTFYNSKGSLAVSNSIFYYNTAPQGGAIYTEDSVGTVYLTKNTFTNNRATRGAGLYHCHGTIVVNNNIFDGNKATINGGAIYIDSTGLSSVDKSMIYFNSCTFTYNRANTRHGGAIYNGGAFRATSCVFKNNIAYAGGGVICNAQGIAIVTSSILRYNKAGKGGALYSNYGRVYLIKNTLAQNAGVCTVGYAHKGIYLWRTRATFQSNQFLAH